MRYIHFLNLKRKQVNLKDLHYEKILKTEQKCQKEEIKKASCGGFKSKKRILCLKI